MEDKPVHGGVGERRQVKAGRGIHRQHVAPALLQRDRAGCQGPYPGENEGERFLYGEHGVSRVSGELRSV